MNRYRTVNSRPNHKVVTAAVLSFITPILASYIDRAVLEVDAMTGGTGAILGLLTGAVTFVGAYLKRPGPGDGVIPDPTQELHH